MALTLMYITNDPEVALIAEKYGVDRVWVDLETLGKEERQKGQNTVKSHHSVGDIRKIAPRLTASKMMVRIDPWHTGSPAEIEAVIAAGAQIVMLPMWKTPEEVASFLRAVDGRCTTSLLLETKEAEECLDTVLELSGIDEIHVGLNDLHLSYGLTFMFELLADGTVERICRKIRSAGIPYGFGGIARLGYGDLPAELVIAEHYRLGSTRAILSRSFCDAAACADLTEIDRQFRTEMRKLRAYEETVRGYSEEEYRGNTAAVKCKVNDIVNRMRGAAEK